MRNLFQLVLMTEVIFVTISCSDLERIDSESSDSKIVGGFELSLTDAPFLASLQKSGAGHYCGAAILTLGSVLTGCHCLGNVKLGVKKGQVELRKWDDVTVYVGSENIDVLGELSQQSGVRTAIIHPECSFEKYLVFDFGVLFLSSPFKISPKVHPFELVSLEKQPFDRRTVELINNEKEKCYVAGWGTTSSGVQRHSSIVRAVRMKLIPDEECAEKLGRENIKFKDFRFAENTQTCSLSYGTKKNASDCVGDSGGPFYCGKKVFAIVSYGFDCGFWDTPNAYAKLSFFVDWYSKIKHQEGELRTSLQASKSSVTVRTMDGHNACDRIMIFKFFLGLIIKLFVR